MQKKVVCEQWAADNFKIWFQRIKVPPLIWWGRDKILLGFLVMGSETPLTDLTSPFFPLKPSQTVSVSHISIVCSLPIENSHRGQGSGPE